MVMAKKQKQDEALFNACKFCVYPADIEDKTIDIPENELIDGSEELSVRYLVKNYGFKIQSVIPGTVEKKNHFEPVLKEKKQIIELGLKFKNNNTGGVYEVITDINDGVVVIRDTIGKDKDKHWLVDDLTRVLKSGKYTIMLQKPNVK